MPYYMVSRLGSFVTEDGLGLGSCAGRWSVVPAKALASLDNTLRATEMIHC